MSTSPRNHTGSGRRFAGLALTLVCTLGLASCSGDSPSDPGHDAPTATAASMLDFQTPTEGAMLAQGTDDPSPVDIAGSVCDSTVEVTSLLLNGTDQLLTGAAPCFDFATTVESRWGLNTLNAQVTTANGVTTNFVRSYLRSPDYFAPQPPPKGAQRAETSVVPAGVVVRMTQDFMDDGTRWDGTDASVDDLATVFQMAVRSVDLADGLGSTLLAGPSLKTCNCLWPIPDLTIHGNGAAVTGGTLSWAPARVVSMDLRSGGVDVVMEFNDFALPLSVTGYLGDCVTSCVDRLDTRVTITGDMYLDRATATTSLDIGLGPNGQPAVTVRSLQVGLTGLEFDIDWGLLDFIDGIANAIANSIIDSFEANIQAAVAEAIRDQIPELTRDFLNAWRPPSLLDLPAPFSRQLRLGSAFDRIEFAADEAVIGIAATIEPAVQVAVYSTGSIERGGSPPSFGGATGNLMAGVKDDLLNQFLYAVWASGALDVTDFPELTCALPEGTSLQVSSTLPPVIMPSTGSAPIEVGVGDLQVTATLSAEAAARYGASDAGEVHLVVAATAGAALEFDPDGYRFNITLEDGYEPSFSILGAPAGSDLEALVAEYEPIIRCMVQELLERLLDAFPMPAVAIGATGITGIPGNAVWQMGNPQLERQSAFTAVSGDVQLR